MEKLILLKKCEVEIRDDEIAVKIPINEIKKSLDEFDVKGVKRKDLQVVLVATGGKKMEIFGCDMKVKL